jgi:hypothetical protein
MWYCYKQNRPDDFVRIGLDINEDIDIKVSSSSFPEVNSLKEMKDFLMNADMSKINP